MTIETEQEYIDEVFETDMLKKPFAELSDSERAKIVKELTIYSLSDEWIELDSKLASEAEELREQIFTELDNKGRDRTAKFTPADREHRTQEYMDEITTFIVGGIGAEVFKNKLTAGSLQYKKGILDRMEVGYDMPSYSDLDMIKNERLLRLSVKVWLSQTITSYEKSQPAEEVKGAY